MTTDSRRATLADARELARGGMFLDALKVLQPLGSLRDWTGEDRVDIAWIVRELGAPRLALWHTLKAYRESPESISVRNNYASEMIDDRGPLETLEFLESNPGPGEDATAEEKMHWMWLNAGCLGILRDFSATMSWIERMEQVGERLEDAHFLRAQILEKQDRYVDALESIDRAIDLRRSHRALQYKAHLLTLTGSDDDAYELLATADQEKQVASFSWQMSAIAYERRDYADCERLLARFEDLTPLRERAFADAFLMVRGELARRRGDDEQAIAYVLRSRSAHGRELAEMLADPARKDATDIVLDVPFVRQHEMTCGPATLAAISRFWKLPAEHLEVAEEICYAGTSSHAERRWAEDNGYTTREFTVTEPATEALIKRGVPFTLVTRGAGFAHLQAVVGYDGRTSTVLIRDPYHRGRGMGSIQKLLESQAAHGPRGMALVPKEQGELIADLELPDAEYHDLLHQFDAALIKHHREDAIIQLGKLREHAAEHRITWQAERQLAIYDANDEAMLAAVRKLMEMYPEDASLQLAEVALMGSLGRNTARVQRLRDLMAQAQPHPLLILQLGDALALDGRTRDEAEQLIRKAIRYAITHSRAYLSLADLWFMRGKRKEALRIYRFAACLEETDEYVASRYFDAALVTGHTSDVLEWLRGRFARYGGKSNQPTATLVDALLRCRLYAEAMQVMDDALVRRPDDAELKLYVARTLAELSSEHWERANRLLEDAREGAPERYWHSVASRLCVLRGQLTEARDYLVKLLPRNPLSLGLREEISDLTSRIEGPDASIEQWRAAAAEFPHHIPLQERYAMALRDRPLDVTQPILEKIIADNPENAWAIRELAQHLLSSGRMDEGEALIRRAEELDHEDPFIRHLRSTLAYRRGDIEGSQAILREALCEDITNDFAAGRLLAICQTREETRVQLDWLLGQLESATLVGDELLLYRDYADGIVEPDELLAQLMSAREARPDFWPAHQVVIRQLTHMRRLDDAVVAADAAVERFPMEPNTWYERCQVALAMGDLDKQMEMLQQLRLLRPGSAFVLRALADLHSNRGEWSTAREILEELVLSQPLDAISRGYLGDCLADLEEYELALDQFERAVRLMPDYDFAWNMLKNLAGRLEKPDLAEQVARQLTEERSHDEACWLQLAGILIANEHFDEAAFCLDTAEGLNPYNVMVHSKRGHLLLLLGDVEGALAALEPPIYTTLPGKLRLDRAQVLWDLGQRDAAFATVKQAAEDDPAFDQAWQLLEHWAMVRGDREQAVAAIDHRVLMHPSDPEALDAAGNAYFDLNESERAIEVFRRAIEIAPNFTGSRCRLFDLLIAADRWDEAEPVVTNLNRLDDHPAVIARRMKVAHHRHDAVARDSAWQAIISAVPINYWALGEAVEIQRQAHADSEVEDMLMSKAMAQAAAVDARLAQDESPTTETIIGVAVNLPNEDDSEVTIDDLKGAVTALTEAWLGSKLPDGQMVSGVVVAEVEQQAIEWLGAATEGQQHMGQILLSRMMSRLVHEKSLTQFNRVLKRNESLLRGDSRLWSVVTYAMADKPRQFSQQRKRDWIADHTQREDLEPWMKTNLHELLRLLGQEEAARRVVEGAMEQPADIMRSQLALWASHDALVEGRDRDAMRYFMQAARLEELEGNDRLLHTWVEAPLALRQTENPRELYPAIKEMLQATEPTILFFREQPLYAAMYARTLKMIADSVGTMQAKIWCFSKRIRIQIAGKWKL